jgi:hypothetical protein
LEGFACYASTIASRAKAANQRILLPFASPVSSSTCAAFGW